MADEKLVIKKSDNWSKSEIEALIEAFKEESCLYARNQRDYRNKRLRAEALTRVHNKMLRLRPKVTIDECQKKIKNLRNQFVIENAKVRASLKSDGGTDEIYKPGLWYYYLLLFLDTYVTPRKRSIALHQQDQQPGFCQSPSTVINVVSHKDESVQLGTNEFTIISAESLKSEPGNVSPSYSIPSTSGRSTIPQRTADERVQMDWSDNTANTRLSSDDPTVDGFLAFIGALLRSFHNEELKLQVMNEITQTVINAKSSDL